MDETAPPPPMSSSGETGFTAPKTEFSPSNLNLNSLESFNFTEPPPMQMTEITSAINAVDAGAPTLTAINKIANIPEVTPPVTEGPATTLDLGNTVLETQVPPKPTAETDSQGPLKPEDGKKIVNEAEDFLTDEYNNRQNNPTVPETFNPDVAQVIPVNKKTENAAAPQGQAKTAEVDPASRDFANAGKKPEVQLPYGKTKEQYEQDQKKHYKRLVETGQKSQEDADRAITDSLKNYDAEYGKLNPDAAEEKDTEAKMTPEEKVAAVIDDIRNGKGKLMDNLIILEYAQVQYHGGEFSPEMRNALADMLQTQIETQGKTENQEALTVLQQIAEMIGLEAQLKKVPEQLKELDEKADELDDQIDRMYKEIRFNNTELDQKERNELYNAYVMLTQTEAQMVHLIQIQNKMEQRFKEISNNIDYTLDRKNGFSYAWGAIKNTVGRVSLNLSTPSLRSARHRGKFGF